jgi:hypothetical protein
VLLDDSPAYRQTQPRTSGVRAEAGIEDARQVLGRNSWAIVGDGQRNPTAVFGRDFVAAQLNPAAFPGGARAVEDKVQQHLLQAVAVGLQDNALQAVLEGQDDAVLPRERHEEGMCPIEQAA